MEEDVGVDWFEGFLVLVFYMLANALCFVACQYSVLY